MSWRPDNWDKGGNPIIDGVKYHNYNESDFEAGADAMLEGLKEKSSLMSSAQMKLLAPDRQYPYGWLVFIPDEG